MENQHCFGVGRGGNVRIERDLFDYMLTLPDAVLRCDNPYFDGMTADDLNRLIAMLHQGNAEACDYGEAVHRSVYEDAHMDVEGLDEVEFVIRSVEMYLENKFGMYDVGGMRFIQKSVVNEMTAYGTMLPCMQNVMNLVPVSGPFRSAYEKYFPKGTNLNIVLLFSKHKSFKMNTLHSELDPGRIDDIRDALILEYRHVIRTIATDFGLTTFVALPRVEMEKVLFVFRKFMIGRDFTPRVLGIPQQPAVFYRQVANSQPIPDGEQFAMMKEYCKFSEEQKMVMDVCLAMIWCNFSFPDRPIPVQRDAGQFVKNAKRIGVLNMIGSRGVSSPQYAPVLEKFLNPPVSRGVGLFNGHPASVEKRGYDYWFKRGFSFDGDVLEARSVLERELKAVIFGDVLSSVADLNLTPGDIENIRMIKALIPDWYVELVDTRELKIEDMDKWPEIVFLDFE